MNKFAVASALAAVAIVAVVMLADVANANKVPRKVVEEVFEEEHGCHGHGGHGGHGVHGGHHEGGEGHFGHGPVRVHPKRHGGGGRVGRGSFAGAGAVGGFRKEGELDAGVHSHTKFGDRSRIEGHKGFSAGDRKELHGGFDEHSSNDNAAIRRRKVLNKDKFIVKETDRGVDDLDEVRHHNDQGVSGNFGASDTKFIGANAGASASNDKEFEKDFDAGFHGEASKEAVGAVGVGAGRF